MPLVNVIVYGFADALNPCNLSTLVIFTAILGWLRRGKVSPVLNGWAFVVLSFIASLIYATGGLMNILYSFPFFMAMRVLYVVLGVIFVWAGVLHFMDWVKLYKGSIAEFALPLLEDRQGKPCSGILAKLVVITAAFVLNAFSTVWPANKYITFYSNYLHMPGEFKATIIMLIVYCMMLAVPMALAPVWMSWTSQNGWVYRNMSKAKISISAFLIGLGVSLIYVFVRAVFMES